ncbi:hypothetical protein C9374_008929 [Naegleria lovaniensis]|uniref:tRNA pseudouridine(55) synthase n=1 Tax=Naegleria lovaniensis TaxID=51637 RepID=A0AA88GEE8_NAELO|nr:uncharacterized protein C9374_008929 [Naegleria lovaniensis]KAG2377844.1 hypothetical protein C9374_008929 [Naegleria lovaniensis]
MNFQSKGSKLCLQRQTPLATQRRTRTMTKTIRFTGLAHLNQEDESYSTRDSSTSLHLSTSLNPCPHHHQQHVQQHEKIKNTLKIYKGPARNAHSLFQSSSFLQKHASHYTEIDWIKTPMVDCALLNHSKYFTSVNEFRNYLYDENMSCVIPMYKPRGISSQSFIIEFKKKFDLDKRMRIGHSGSLDPSAYGLLILGVNGQGTKALNYIPDSNCKDYEFVIQCGSCTPSYDSDTIQFANHCSNYKYFFDKNCQSIEQVNEKIQKYLNERNNHLIQTTPVFSAVKKGGKRLQRMDIKH